MDGASEIQTDHSENLYKQYTGVRIKGEIVQNLQGYQIETDKGFPFRALVDVGGTPTPTFSLAGTTINPSGQTENSIGLEQTTKHHGRAFEIKLSEKGPAAIWSDENGIIYGTVNVKGNNLEDPKVEKDKYFESGFKTHGLQENIIIARTIQASKILREYGVETEKTEIVIKPGELVVDGKVVSIDEFKQYLLAKAKEDAQKPHGGGLSGESSTPTEKELFKVEEYVNNAEYLITVRGLQVSERLRDIKEAQTKEGFEEMMDRVFRFVNIREKIEAKKEGRTPRVLVANSFEDLEYYFTDYLPNRIAVNVGKMHNSGLKHSFLTDHNVSLAGSIYDLDSLEGETLGDKKIDNFSGDLAQFTESLQSVFLAATRGPEKHTPSYFAKELGPKFVERFITTFISKYAQQRFLQYDIEGAKEEMDNELKKDLEEMKRENGGAITQETINEILEEVKTNGHTLKDELKDGLKLTIKLWTRGLIDRSNLMLTGRENLYLIEDGLEKGTTAATEEQFNKTVLLIGEEFFDGLEQQILNSSTTP